ncbi:MAG: CARDB domain-containing protein [Methanomicrobium sp.]|nr:CARDB domain-containing protein [Methanomicrobium sp.]
MSDKNYIHAGFAILILALLTAVAPALAGTIYYYQDTPVASPEYLTLKGFSVSGETAEIYPGDEVTAKYMIHYEPQSYNQLVIDQPGGLYFDLTDPDGTTTRLGTNYIGKTIEPDAYISITESFTPDKPGTWKISPAYTVVQGNLMSKKSNPKNWQTAEIHVKGISKPRPDLIISDAKAEFDAELGIISRISYTIKNTGDADSQPSSSIIYIDGYENSMISSTGYLPSGESATIFEPAGVKYSGSSTLLKIEADYAKLINESDKENNKFEIVVQNPGYILPNKDTKNEAPAYESLPVLESKPVAATEYNVCPVQGGCFDICFLCAVAGVLSILVSVLSFALGYYYGLNKNCEREVLWMRSKLEILRTGSKNSYSAKEMKKENVAKVMEENLDKAVKNLDKKDENKKDKTADKNPDKQDENKKDSSDDKKDNKDEINKENKDNKKTD